MMETYNDIYLRVRRELKAAGVEASELEARLIVTSCAQRSREELLAMSKLYATDIKIRMKIDEYLERRLQGEPIAYIVGEWEFYGIPLVINEHVLIPRVDTEVLAREAIELLKGRVHQSRVLDLCAGSGCVGLAIAKHIPGCRVVMIDSSVEALAVCRQNTLLNSLSKNITVIEADVLEKPPAIMGEFDLIVSNPPYIPTADIATLDYSVKDYEPLMALDGGEDGLKFYRAIVSNWSKLLKDGGQLAFECGEGQAAAVRHIMKEHGFMDITTHKDTLDIERVVIGMLIT